MPDFSPRYVFPGPPRIALETASVRTPDGAVYTHHRLSAGRGGAAVIARSRGRVLFLRITRPAADDEVFVELPRGWVDEVDAQDGVVAAVRELREETGFAAYDARNVGTYVLDTGIYPQRVTVVVCEVDDAAPLAATDGEADGGWLWLPEGELDQLITGGTLRDAHTLAALSLWRATGVDERRR